MSKKKFSGNIIKFHSNCSGNSRVQRMWPHCFSHTNLKIWWCLVLSYKDIAVVCILCINGYVWRVWWGWMGKDLHNTICYINLSYLAIFRVWPGNDQRATSWCEKVADRTWKAKETAGLWTPCLDLRCLDKQSLREYLIPQIWQDNF